MNLYIFDLGDIVILNRSVGHLTDRGDYMKITSLEGLKPHTPANPNHYYRAIRVDSNGKSISSQSWTVHHRDIESIRDKELRLKMLRERLEQSTTEKGKIEEEIDIISKYKSKEDYLAHKIKEVVDTDKSDSKIMNILKSKVPDYLIF